MNKIKKMLIAALVAVSLVLAGSSPADATESLTKWEAKRVTKVVLRSYIGPAVTDSTDPTSKVDAWDCHVSGDTGTCKGRVVAGSVTCHGKFKVRQTSPSTYAGWPIRMICKS